MAQQQRRTYLVTAGSVTAAGVRRYPLAVGRSGRHRADDWYSRRVPTPLHAPAPGRHRAPGRQLRGTPGRPVRPYQRLASLGLTLAAAVAVVSAWFAVTGAAAMAAMVR